MALNFLMCRFVQRNLDAFLDGRLSPRARRRLAHHIDTCSACYRVYAQQRDLRRELHAALPLAGHDHRPDFDRMWGAIRAELPRPQPRQTQFRYGLVALVLLLTLLTPLTMGNHELTRPVPSQPAPHPDAATETPERTGEPAALSTAVASSATLSVHAQGTTPPTLPEPEQNNKD